MYRISFEKLSELYRYYHDGVIPETATLEDAQTVPGPAWDEKFGEYFDRIKPELDLYEEAI
jgi:hypothetical protein